MNVIGNRFLDVSVVSGVFSIKWKCDLLVTIQNIQSVKNSEEYHYDANVRISVGKTALCTFRTVYAVYNLDFGRSTVVKQLSARF